MSDSESRRSVEGIRPATILDVPAIARIHKPQFAGHLLAEYSLSSLERFYSTFLNHAVFLVHDGEAGIDGFVMGAERPVCGACRRRFIHAGALRLAWETFWRPQIVRKAFQRFCQEYRAQPRAAHASPEFRLVSIAVDPRAAGTGVAAMLVRAFEDSIPSRFSTYGLSVRRSNGRAVRFYEKMGFERESGDPSSGSYSYAKSLPGRPGSAPLENGATTSHESRRLAA